MPKKNEERVLLCLLYMRVLYYVNMEIQADSMSDCVSKSVNLDNYVYDYSNSQFKLINLYK